MITYIIMYTYLSIYDTYMCVSQVVSAYRYAKWYMYIWLCAINPPQPMARKVVRYAWCQDCLFGFMQIRIDTKQRLDLWSNSSIVTYGKKFTELAPKPCFGEASFPHSISLHRWLIRVKFHRSDKKVISIFPLNYVRSRSNRRLSNPVNLKLDC